MLGHKSPISGIAAFSDKLVATAGYDNQVILWDAKTKTACARANHDHLANQCTFSPDGRFLATASSDYTARLWRLPDMKLVTVFGEHEDDVEMITFHPTEELLATACRDFKVRIFDFAGNLKATLVGHTEDVNSVEWSADGTELTSTSDDCTVRVWDAALGRQKSFIDMSGVQTDTLVFSRDGTIYAGNDEGEISIVRQGSVSKVKAHKAGIKRLVIDRRRGLLVSMSYDRSVRVWSISLDGLDAVLSAALPAIIWPRSCAFKGDKELVFATFGTSYATFNLETQEWDLTAIGHTHGVNAVAHIGRCVYTVGDSGTVRKDGQVITELGSLCNFLTPFEDVLLAGGQMGQVFDAFTGKLLYTHTSPLNCGVAYTTPSGEKRAMVGTYTGEGLVFAKDATGAIVMERIEKLQTNAIKGLAALDGVILSACATAAVAFHKMEDYSLIRHIDHAHAKIANGSVSVAGLGFATVGRDLKLRTWSLSGEAIDVLETPHAHSIKCVAASADGRLVAAAAYDGRVSIVDLKSKKWVRDLKVTNAGVSSITAVPEGFLAGSYDGSVYPIEIQAEPEVKEAAYCKALIEVTSRAAMSLPESFTHAKVEVSPELFRRMSSLGINVLVALVENPAVPLVERLAAGKLLAVFGDPRLDVLDPAMVTVPGGRAVLGLEPEKLAGVVEELADTGIFSEWIEKECPVYEVQLKSFRIGKYPVTNQEYLAFLEDDGFTELPSSWIFGKFSQEHSNLPVYTVSETAADRYAAWLSRKTGRKFRLPTEAEWEFAAAGPERLEFPWGNTWDPAFCNTLEAGLLSASPVGIFPQGNSPFGACDMAGNVEEYVADDYHAYPGAKIKIDDDLTRVQGRENGRYRVARGGSFTRRRDLARCKRRHGMYPKDIYVMTFRLAEDV